MIQPPLLHLIATEDHIWIYAEDEDNLDNVFTDQNDAMFANTTGKHGVI